MTPAPPDAQAIAPSLIVWAIDPGPEQSALAIYNAVGPVVQARKHPNAMIVRLLGLPAAAATVLVIEEMVSYGMVAGRSMFQTCFWAGRFAERWAMQTGTEARLLSRIAVKRQLCHATRASDKDIREELIHRFGPPGSKKAPGLTYGLAGDCWAALALAVAFNELETEQDIARRHHGETPQA